MKNLHNNFNYFSTANLTIILTLLCTSIFGQTGTCFDPFILNLNEQWTKVGSINTIDKVWFEFTSPGIGTLEYCPVNGQMSVEILSGCDPLDVVQWTDTGIECAPPTQFCPDPQNLFIYSTNVNEKILIGIQGTEDPFTCVGPIEIRYVASGNTCADPTPISCGETAQFTTDLLTNMVNWLDCGGPSFPSTGQDKTFILDMTSSSDITIDMSSAKGDRDRLGVYRICNDCQAGCFFTDCEALDIQSGNESITILGASGQYLIVCDWEPIDQTDFDDGNEFQLSISCSPCTSNDIVDPIVSCPVSKLFAVAPYGQNCTDVYYPRANASDDCLLDNVTYSAAFGSCFPVGTTVVIVTATDACGNSATCSFDVEVVVDCCKNLDRQADNLFNTSGIGETVMDIDNDGVIELFALPTHYWDNLNGTPGDYPLFDISGGILPISFTPQLFPHFVYPFDYDNDGFTDIFALVVDKLYFCKNDGIAGTASYTVTEAMTLPFFPQSSLSYFAIGDLSNDGVPDFVLGETDFNPNYYYKIIYFEGIPSNPCGNGQPCFQLAGNSLSSPFITGSDLNGNEFPGPEIYDNDCDGDNDLFVAILGEMHLYENNGSQVPLGMLPPLNSTNPIIDPYGINGIATSGSEYILPKFVDVDNDGEDELFINETNVKTQFYERCGDMVLVATNEAPKRSGITVFPNPAYDEISVSLIGADAFLKLIQVFNLQGSLVYSSTQQDRPGTMEIDCSLFPAGVFLLKVIDSNRDIYLEKLIVIK